MKLLRGKANSAEVKTLNGRDYLVVPVIALVEGVRHASGAASPELVPVDSFGRYPETWNGRPVVVDHPVDAKGRGMSASDVVVLEDSYLGKMLNSRVEDGKLKTEAWLDLIAIDASESDKVLDMWARLESGEIVEVSVGAIVTVKDIKGEYEGKDYEGVWDTVIPDHLAFLSGDQRGACSIEDGCGTYRTQSSGRIQLSEGVRMASKAAMKKVKAASAVQLVTTEGEDEAECACKGSGSGSGSESRNGGDAATEARRAAAAEYLNRTLFAAEMFDSDRRTFLQRAVSDVDPGCSVLAFNDKSVVYEKYDGKKFRLYQVGYSVDEGNTVTLSGEPEEVVFQAKVVPVTKKTEDDEDKKSLAAAGDKGKSKKSAPPAAEDDEEDDEEETPPRKAKSTTKGKEKKMSNGADDDGDELAGSLAALMKQYKGTPVGRELSEMVAFATDAKEKAKKAILSAKGGKHFTEEMLDGMDLKVLSGMAAALSESDLEDEEVGDDEEESDDDDANDTADDTDTLAVRGKGGGVQLKKGGSRDGGGRPRNYAGRAGAPRQARGGVPDAPDVFAFDDDGYLQDGQKNAA